ncbi:MAG: protein NO VEIN domain-containing protein [Candidatus Rokuibacteriota bacterium]
MPQVDLVFPRAGHIPAVIRALLRCGWTVSQIPTGGTLARNGLHLVLRVRHGDVRIRLFVYKVTGSGRGKPDERRIEITSTYQKGLARVARYRDIVLGYDPEHDLFVGVDPERVAHGGPTGNASSFFDRAGLLWRHPDRVYIRQREARLQAIEFHAFVKPQRLAEYLFNSDEIHRGVYAYTGPFSGRTRSVAVPDSITVPTARARGDALVLDGPEPTRRRSAVRAPLVKALEEGDIDTLRRRRITPEQFEELRRRFEENGRLGEDYVLKRERQLLRRAGRNDLAERVRLVSLESVAEGYDILSYTSLGERKLIEVKATTSDSPNFEMSEPEWRICCANSARYYVYRVTRVRTNPRLTILRNLPSLEAEGRLTKTATGWMVRPVGT